jgi:hypothetical protein
MASAWSATPSDFSNGTTGVTDLAVRGARQGSADARQAAERFYRSGSLFAARFIYTACYTMSYGVVFSTVMVARSIPRENAAVRGLVDGSGAARRRVDSVLGRPEGS